MQDVTGTGDKTGTSARASLDNQGSKMCRETRPSPPEGGGSHMEALRPGLRGPPRFTDPDAAVLSSGHHFRKLGMESQGFSKALKPTCAPPHPHVPGAAGRSAPGAHTDAAGLRQASRPCAEQPLPQRRSPESEPGAVTTPLVHTTCAWQDAAPQPMTVDLSGKRVHWEPATCTPRSLHPHLPCERLAPHTAAAVFLRPNQPEHLTPAIQGRLSAGRLENAEHKDEGPRGSVAARPFSLQASE